MQARLPAARCSPGRLAATDSSSRRSDPPGTETAQVWLDSDSDSNSGNVGNVLRRVCGEERFLRHVNRIYTVATVAPALPEPALCAAIAAAATEVSQSPARGRTGR